MSGNNSASSQNCPGDQSPINLSHTFSKPCEMLCEIVMDDIMVPQGYVLVDEIGLGLHSQAGLGTCKYNGEEYTSSGVVINHPSYHTVENVQADGEVIAIFTNVSGKYLLVSSLFRVNSAETPSTHFFNSFVQYANPTQPNVPVNLGDNWNLAMMVPSQGAYFVYDGSTFWDCTKPAKWIVFQNMINMDPNTFAFLVKTVAPSSKPVQPLGSREVFFNSIEHVGGTPMAKGDKKYMRCKKLGAPTKAVKPVQSSPLKSKSSGNSKNFSDSIMDYASTQYQLNGAMYYISGIISFISVVISIFIGIKFSFIGLHIIDFHQRIPDYLKRLFTYLIAIPYNYIWVPLMKKPEQTV
jgi:carbonic anhydrase